MDDDDLTPEEQAMLATLDSEAPPVTETVPVDTAAPAAEPTPADPAAPPAPAAPGAPAVQTEEERFAAWRAQHNDKSPEELARIAFQQSQRANQSGFQARRAQETLETFQQRAREAVERAAAKKADIAAQRTRFEERLATDPDAATRDVNERLLNAEEEEAEREAHIARVDAAIGIASQAIPDFQQQAPHIFGFGGEMGYSSDEMDGMTDHRDIVTLYLASLSGKLIKGGLMDTRGNLVAMPPAVDPKPTDPRLTAPAPVATLSSTAARPAGGGKAPEQRGMDILNLSDADFAKIPPQELENLLAQLSA